MNKAQRYYKKKEYFEGWYLKHQKEGRSIAFIPAFHKDADGLLTASIQVVMNNASYNFTFTENKFYISDERFCVKIGQNLFSEKGISVRLEKEGTVIMGTLRYSSFAMLHSDIMGPFHLLPFMQCNHGVLSMIHRLEGTLSINGEEFDFTGGVGYVEKDYGTSFPQYYTWTQCSDWSGKQDCSLMASAAHIPFGPIHFNGCICAVWYHGKEYRLATYLGASIVKNEETELEIRQGRYRLKVKRTDVLPDGDKKLYAPRRGRMSRTIKENIACMVHYRFTVYNKVIFDFTSSAASFEFVK